MTVENEGYRAVEWLEESYEKTYDFCGNYVSHWKYGRIKATNWQQPLIELKDDDDCGNGQVDGQGNPYSNCHCNNDDVVHNLWRMDWRPGFEMTEEETSAWVASGRSHAHGWHPDRDEDKHEQPVPTARRGPTFDHYILDEFADTHRASLPASFGRPPDFDHIDLFTRGLTAPDFS